MPQPTSEEIAAAIARMQELFGSNFSIPTGDSRAQKIIERAMPVLVRQIEMILKEIDTEIDNFRSQLRDGVSERTVLETNQRLTVINLSVKDRINRCLFNCHPFYQRTIVNLVENILRSRIDVIEAEWQKNSNSQTAVERTEKKDGRAGRRIEKKSNAATENREGVDIELSRRISRFQQGRGL